MGSEKHFFFLQYLIPHYIGSDITRQYCPKHFLLTLLWPEDVLTQGVVEYFILLGRVRSGIS